MKSERIDLRVRPDQKLYWVESSETLGLDLSEMIRRATDWFIKSELNNVKVGSVRNMIDQGAPQN